MRPSFDLVAGGSESAKIRDSGPTPIDGSYAKSSSAHLDLNDSTLSDIPLEELLSPRSKFSARKRYGSKVSGPNICDLSVKQPPPRILDG